jgi:hypothetical protein
VAKQNSAYGPTRLHPMTGKPYPADWERVADLRVLRTTVQDWEKLISWRTDMRRRGWKLLRVSHDGPELVAVFGRTKAEPPRLEEPETRP